MVGKNFHLKIESFYYFYLLFCLFICWFVCWIVCFCVFVSFLFVFYCEFLGKGEKSTLQPRSPIVLWEKGVKKSALQPPMMHASTQCCIKL